LKDQKKRLDSAVMMVSWLIWKQRNARVFNNAEKTLNQLLSDIFSEDNVWVQAGASKLSGIGWPSRNSKHPHPTPPPKKMLLGDPRLFICVV